MESVLPRYLVGLFGTSRRRKVPRSDKELTPDYEILFRVPRVRQRTKYKASTEYKTTEKSQEATRN
jgi:hypothetical protein